MNKIKIGSNGALKIQNKVKILSPSIITSSLISPNPLSSDDGNVISVSHDSSEPGSTFYEAWHVFNGTKTTVEGFNSNYELGWQAYLPDSNTYSDGAYFIYDFGSSKTITSIKFWNATLNPNWKTDIIKVYVGNNSSNISNKIIDSSGHFNDINWTNTVSNTISGRYVKIQIINNGSEVGVNEIEIYGY